jgi:hypothetical protein
MFFSQHSGCAVSMLVRWEFFIKLWAGSKTSGAKAHIHFWPDMARLKSRPYAVWLGLDVFQPAFKLCRFNAGQMGVFHRAVGGEQDLRG